MNDLEQEVRVSIKGLREVENKIQVLAAQSDTVIHRTVYTTWLEKTQYAKCLEDSLQFFPVRAYAEKWLVNLSAYIKSHLCEPIDTMIGYLDSNIPVSIARTLAINSYLAAYWGLYDRLSNAIGRVVGTDTIRKNPQGKANPKIVETFLPEKQGIDILGMKSILMSSYGEQVGFSYLLRNCFVHEVGMVGDLPILSGTISGDAFMISQSVADKLNAEIAFRYKMPNVTIAKRGDLFEQLRYCHASMDNMFVSLLQFMCGTLVAEIQAFATVDGFTFP